MDPGGCANTPGAWPILSRRTDMSENTPATERVCTKCGTVKPLAEFNRSKDGLHGRRSRCSTCQAEEGRRRRDVARGGPGRQPRTPSPDGTLRCTKCHEVRRVEDFRPEPRNRDGLRSQCKQCDRYFAWGWQKRTGQYERWRRENPEAYRRLQRRSALRRKYGMEIEDYDALLAAQGGRCAICRSTDPKSNRGTCFVVDHDHDTGAVRGLLCMICNTGIGGLQDDPRIVAAALQYLVSAHMERQTGMTVELGAAMAHAENAIQLLDFSRLAAA